jgi:hypothetical protein
MALSLALLERYLTCALKVHATTLSMLDGSHLRITTRGTGDFGANCAADSNATNLGTCIMMTRYGMMTRRTVLREEQS